MPRELGVVGENAHHVKERTQNKHAKAAVSWQAFFAVAAVSIVRSDDIQIVDRVTRALLTGDAKDTSERALKYAQHYEELIGKLRIQSPPGGFSPGQWAEELDRGRGRALVTRTEAARSVLTCGA